MLVSTTLSFQGNRSRFPFQPHRLKQGKSLQDPVWTGFKNFETLFSKPMFWRAFKNTLFLSIAKLLLNTFAAVVVSLLLNEIINVHFKKVAQTIIYLPHFLSWVVTASVFGLILSPSSQGLVNSFSLFSNIWN